VQAISPKSREAATIQLADEIWGLGKRGSKVLITGRDQEQYRRNRIEALPLNGITRTITIGGQKQLRLKGHCLKAESGQPDKICIDPLYLFACAMLWHKRADAGAGWELVRGMKSAEPGARIATALLAETKDLQLRVRELRRALANPGTPAPESAAPTREVGEVVATMNTPYGLEIIENCVSCKLRQDKWFCGLSPDVLKSFSASSHLSTYPGGAVLFVEGQMPRGGLVLCSGKVKLSTTSRDGKVLILKMAVPGEALGLSAVISGTPYELTAETAGPCQVNFIDRESLMKLLDKYGELGLHSAQALSREFQSAYRDIHELVLARSSAGKLARLLLSWSAGRAREGGLSEVRIRSSLTHEEIAQMIGSSRETVTRLLGELKKKELIRLEGSTLVIRNRTALEALAA
jgi:CRP/FNR family cyclic AMP-dependent transcriptional regulator